MDPFVPPSPYRAVPLAAVRDRAQQQVNGYPKQQEPPAGKRRRISLSDEVHRLTLAETTGSPDLPVKATVAAQPSVLHRAVADRRALKTALYKLTNDALSPADFVMIVNHFGYQPLLHDVPLDTLRPFHWLALRERARRQILRHQGSLLALLPQAAITCDLLLAAYRSTRKAMFSLVPERLKDSFFTRLIERYPVAILDIAAKEQTFSRLLSACCRNSAMLWNLPSQKRTAALAIEVCQRTGYGLEYIAEQQRSYTLCLKACKTNGKALEHVPPPLKNDELCRAALLTYGLAYRWLPKELAQKEDWQLLACQQDGSVLKWIPPKLHDNALLKAACRSDGAALMFIDKDRITYEICRLACSQDASAACQYIPLRHLDATLRYLICSTTDDDQLCERFSIKTADFYERVLQANHQASLKWVPTQCRTAAHYLLACQNKGADLKLVPEQQRTPEICLAACHNYGAALQWVPEQHRTAEICLAACKEAATALAHVRKGELPLEWFVKEAMYDHANYSCRLLTHAQRLLSGADFQRLLESTVLCANSYKVAMLILPQLNSAQKSELIEWILEPRRWPTPEPPKQADLCEMLSPLQYTCLLYTSPSPRDRQKSRMPSSA